jgi:hypothetical protein
MRFTRVFEKASLCAPSDVDLFCFMNVHISGERGSIAG